MVAQYQPNSCSLNIKSYNDQNSSHREKAMNRGGVSRTKEHEKQLEKVRGKSGGGYEGQPLLRGRGNVGL